MIIVINELSSSIFYKMASPIHTTLRTCIDRLHRPQKLEHIGELSCRFPQLSIICSLNIMLSLNSWRCLIFPLQILEQKSCKFTDLAISSIFIVHLCVVCGTVIPKHIFCDKISISFLRPGGLILLQEYFEPTSPLLMEYRYFLYQREMKDQRKQSNRMVQ